MARRCLTMTIGTAVALVVGVGSAWGATSYYKTGTLDAAVTYDSVQSPNWNATAIYNQSGTNMNGRVWAYNVVNSVYVMSMPFATFGPGQVYGSSFPRQDSIKAYCRKANGGTQTGSCYATY